MMVIIICDNMYKITKIIKKSLYYTSIGLGLASIGGFAYLQYVNSILGPINIDK